MLRKAGLDVTVVTSGINYMTGNDIRTGSGWCTEEKLNGIRILRIWGITGFRYSISKRILHYIIYTMLSGLASVIKVGRVSRVFTGTDPIFIMPMVFIVSRIKHAAMVFDERDLYPETAIALGVIKEGLITRLLFKMQQFFRSRAVGILSATPGIMDRLLSYGCPEKKIQLLYNADVFLDEDNKKKISVISLRQETGKRFLVGYAGGLGKANDILTLLRTAAHLKIIKDLGIVMLGSGERQNYYEEYCRENNLKNVFFKGSFPRIKARKLINQMDVCVHLLQKNTLFEYAMSSKIFDYIGLGKPIIFCGSGNTEELLESTGAGITVKPGDDRALAYAIRRLYSDVSLRKRMGTSSKCWFDQHISVDNACLVIKKIMKIR